MLPEIFLQNTLTGKKETFKPLKAGEVKIYSCGPTVYDFAHIGNFRSFMMADLLTRVFEYAGYKTTKVQNITDVGHLVSDHDEGEDKILKKARLEKKDPFAIARFFEDAFIEDEKVLRILPPDHRPRATDYITEQINLTQKLIAKGFAYEVNGSVYFRTEQFKTYGQLSKNKLEDLIAGARIEINDEKEKPLDFALWKKAEPNHLMQWDSPWGRGYPGWHIECSAMSQKLLGDHFDIHTGGEDNKFPHHECEIAQNEGANGGHKSVNYWLHTKHLLVDGEKMSKSKGNFYTIRDLLKKGWKGEEIRYALLSAHYRTTLNFSENTLTQARSSIARMREAHRICQEKSKDQYDINENFILPYANEFQRALNDDLNIPEALATVFTLIQDLMKKRELNQLTAAQARSAGLFFEKDFDQIFSVLFPEKIISESEKKEIETLIKKRKQVRNDKDWATSDLIRNQIESQFGVELIDESGTTTWRIKQ